MKCCAVEPEALLAKRSSMPRLSLVLQASVYLGQQENARVFVKVKSKIQLVQIWLVGKGPKPLPGRKEAAYFAATLPIGYLQAGALQRLAEGITLPPPPLFPERPYSLYPIFLFTFLLPIQQPTDLYLLSFPFPAASTWGNSAQLQRLDQAEPSFMVKNLQRFAVWEGSSFPPVTPSWYYFFSSSWQHP